MTYEYLSKYLYFVYLIIGTFTNILIQIKNGILDTIHYFSGSTISLYITLII